MKQSPERQYVLLCQILQIRQEGMLNYKQLYQSNDFYLPQVQALVLNPFPVHPVLPISDQVRDAALNGLFDSPEYHFKSFTSAYSTQFERLTAKDSLYPFMLSVGITKLALVCKDILMLCDWKRNGIGRVFEGGDDLLGFQKWERVKLPQTPTTVRVGRYGLYAGYQSGRISQYCYKTKAWEGSNDELQFPVMQIEVVGEEEGREASLLGLDSAGNIVHIHFSHKTIMDKIIKTLSTARWVSFLFRNKKRQKIKKMFKNLLASEAETQSGSTDTVDSYPFTYTYNKFDLKYINQDIFLAVFRRNTLELLVLERDFLLNKTIVVDDSHKDEKDLQVAVVQLGEGGFENANTTHNVLVLGLGYSVSFYRIIQVEEGYEVVKITQVEMEAPLLYGGFISNNLLALGDRHQLHLASIGAKSHPLIYLDTLKFSYIDFFADQEGLDVDKRLLLGSILGLLPGKQSKDRSFVGLQGKRLIVGSIFSWQTVLQKLIFEKRWQWAMRCFLSIYSLQFKLCCGVSENTGSRNGEMRELCLSISKGYLQSHLSSLRLNPESAESWCIVNNYIYFLLKAEQAQVLFAQAERVFCAWELQRLFVQQLQRYVQQRNGYGLKIPYLSEHYLRLLIKRYKSTSQEYILEQLFMGLDLLQMEQLLLLSTCLQQGLYRSLIGICCEQKDYITPIIKLCGIGLSNPGQQGRLSEIIFWYLGECLGGRMTEFGNELEYLNMLTILVNFVFMPSSLEMLLAANHRYLFRTVALFFEPRVMRYILENEDRFFMRRDSLEGSLFEDNCLSEFKLYERMLAVLVAGAEGSGDRKQCYKQQLNRFLIPLMLRNHFPFLARFKIEIIHYFVGHPLLFIEGAEMTEENEVLVNGQLMRLLDSFVRSISEKCLNLREKIREDPASIKELEVLLGGQKSNELEGILNLMLLSPYSDHLSQTKCYIHHHLAHYSTVLQLYLRMANKRTRLKVFLYLENNLNEYSQLTQQFLRYLLSLLRIDQGRTVRLLWSVREGWVDHEQVIEKLVEYPALQLSYIERAIGEGGERSRKLLLRHLQIVLRERGEEIEKFIAKIDYPLQQAFRMCEQHNNRMGKACILIKSGRNMEGVMIISEIFLEAVKEYLSQLRKGGAQVERKAKIMAQFRVVLQTCHKEWMIDNDRGEDIWEKNTELIFRKMGVYNIDTPHIPEQIRAFLNQIITELFAAMLEQVSTDFFFNRFTKTFASLPLRIFLQAYSYIYGRLEFVFTVEKLNKDILEQQKLATWRDIMASTFRAHVCVLACHACGHALTNNEKMVSYPCSHVYHEECYYERNSKKSKNDLCPLCYTGLENYLICGEGRPPRYRLEVDEKELLRVKMGKMKYYDRTSQFSAMENWGRFEEWVDL